MRMLTSRAPITTWNSALASTAITNGGQVDAKWDRRVRYYTGRFDWLRVWQVVCGGLAPPDWLPAKIRAGSSYPRRIGNGSPPPPPGRGFAPTPTPISRQLREPI